MAHSTETIQKKYIHLVNQYFDLRVKLTEISVASNGGNVKEDNEYVQLKEKETAIEERLDDIISGFDEKDFRIAFQQVGE